MGLIGAGSTFVLCAVIFAIAWYNTALIRRERAGDSICDFARSFPRRSVDTWILRSVYEEISRVVMFPIRAEDKLYELLGAEWAFDLALDDIAARAKRELNDAASASACEDIFTVRDLVSFLNRRPCIA